MSNESQHVSPCSPCQSLALFMEDSTNYCCQKQRLNFHSSSQIHCKYCDGVAFTVFQHASIKGVRQRFTSTASLEDGYCEVTIPIINTWRNNGSSAWNGSRFKHICAFYVEITNSPRVKLKMSCYNHDYNMTVWIFGSKLYWLSLTAGCVKLQHPASSNRVRHNGERVPASVLMPVSIWFIVIVLEPVTYTSQKHS